MAKMLLVFLKWF